MVFQRKKVIKSTWCIMCAHSIVDIIIPNSGNGIMYGALQRLDAGWRGRLVVVNSHGFAPSRLS